MTIFTATPAQTPTSIAIFGGAYVLVETNAPQVYDYSSINLTPDVSENYPTRFTLIPAEMLDTQFARYHSGLYVGVVSDMFSSDTISDQLLTRMQRLEEM